MKSRTVWLVCVVLLLAGFLAGRFTAPGGCERSSPSDASKCRITKVVDGDTVRLIYDGREEKVRLLWINTPERGEPGYRESTAELKDLVGGKEVEIRFEKPGVPDRDRFGRLLAYLMVDDLNVNLEMVRRGWSEFVTRYGEGPMAASFAEAETEARARFQGLWAE